MTATTDAGVLPASAARTTPLRFADVFAEFLDRYRWFFFAGLLVTYVAGFNGQWQLEPDSALYLSVGRNIALGRGYTYHGLPHDLAYPGLPYALAGIFKVFHEPSQALFAADVLMLLCGIATLALTYRLVGMAYDRATAVVITMGLGASHEFFRYCYEIMTDIPFVMGVMALLAAHEALFVQTDAQHRRRWWDWLLLVFGLTVIVTTRPTMIGLIAVWIIAMIGAAIYRKSLRKWVIVGIVIGMAAIALFLIWDPRSGAAHPTSSYEHHALSQFTGNFLVHLHTQMASNLADLFGQSATRALFGTPLGNVWTNAFLGVFIIGGGILLMGKRMIWGLWVLAHLCMVLSTVSHDRYMIEVLPLLVLGWWRMVFAISHWLPRKLSNFYFAGLVGFGSILNGGLCVAVVVHQHKQPFLSDYKEGRFPPYVSIAKDIQVQAGENDVVLSPIKLSRILTFLSDRRVIEEVADDGIDLTQHRLLVMVDRSDKNFMQWLDNKHVTLVGVPLACVFRGKDLKGAPIYLYRGEVD